MAGPRRRDGDGGASGPDDGDAARGLELQPPRPEGEEGGARARDGGRVPVPATSELLWLLLVGVGHAGGAGERGLSGRVCGGAVEVFQKEDREYVRFFSLLNLSRLLQVELGDGGTIG